MQPEAAPTTEQTQQPEAWFYGRFLPAHKKRNPHSRFREYESGGLETVYRGWIEAFSEIGASRAEMTRASRRLQRTVTTKGLLPEHQLGRLLDLIRAGRGRTRRAEAATNELAERKAKRAEVDARDAERRDVRAAWAATPATVQDFFRDTVRRVHPAAGYPRSFLDVLACQAWEIEAFGRGDLGEFLASLRPAERTAPAPAVVAAPVARPEPTADDVHRCDEIRRDQLARLAVVASTPRRLAV